MFICRWSWDCFRGWHNNGDVSRVRPAATRDDWRDVVAITCMFPMCSLFRMNFKSIWYNVNASVLWYLVTDAHLRNKHLTSFRTCLQNIIFKDVTFILTLRFNINKFSVNCLKKIEFILTLHSRCLPPCLHIIRM